MDNRNNGGPAFPVQDEVYGNGDRLYGSCGMSLRDWFAGMALMGYLSGRNNTRAENPYNFEAKQAAKGCYEYADAMLAAREEVAK